MLELNKSYRMMVEKLQKKFNSVLNEAVAPPSHRPLEMRDAPEEVLANPGIILGPNGEYLNWQWSDNTSPNYGDMIPNASQFDLFPNGQWSAENFTRLIELVDQYIGDIPSLIAYLQQQGISQETITFLMDIHDWYTHYSNVITSSISSQTQGTALGALFVDISAMVDQLRESNPEAYFYFSQLMNQNDGGNPEGTPYGHELTRYLTILFCLYGGILMWEQNTL